jgi:hypothetical protein
MKRNSWLGVGLAALLVGAYVMLAVKIAPDRSRAEPPDPPYEETSLDIVWSDPVNGYIDVRWTPDTDQHADGIRRFAVRFASSVTLTSDRIEVVSTGESPPLVESVTQIGDIWFIELDRSIPAAASTAMVFDAGAAWVLVHSHPGDVNFDGTTDGNDAVALTTAIEAGWTAVPVHDINRDGNVNTTDADALDGVIELFEGASWQVEPLGDVLCCCTFDHCTVTVGTSCDEGGACPCVPNPCEMPVTEQ